MLGEKNLRIDTVNGKKRQMPAIQNIQRTFLGVDLEMVNSYQNLPIKKLKYHERRNAWNRFKHNVEKLAA
jgi:hypothetical protein